MRSAGDERELSGRSEGDPEEMAAHMAFGEHGGDAAWRQADGAPAGRAVVGVSAEGEVAQPPPAEHVGGRRRRGRRETHRVGQQRWPLPKAALAKGGRRRRGGGRQRGGALGGGWRRAAAAGERREIGTRSAGYRRQIRGSSTGDSEGARFRWHLTCRGGRNQKQSEAINGNQWHLTCRGARRPDRARAARRR